MLTVSKLTTITSMLKVKWSIKKVIVHTEICSFHSATHSTEWGKCLYIKKKIGTAKAVPI